MRLAWSALMCVCALVCGCMPELASNPGTAAARPRIESHPAVGELDDLPPELAAVFADDPRWFSPVQKLGPDDWLSTHREPGQTFAQFVANGPRVPSPERRIIYIQPIGAYPSSAPSQELLASYVGLFFGLEVAVLEPIEVESLGARSRDNEYGRQLLTGDVLDALHERLPSDAFLLVGLTMEDLYPGDDWNFVFGFASFKRRVSVYSLLRFDPWVTDSRGAHPDDARAQLTLERSLKVMSHELTHSFGIAHCVHYDCLMNGTNGLDELDAHPLHLCPVCLRKLHSVAAFEPVPRYEQLGRYYQSRGLTDAARWTQARVTALEPSE